MTTNPTGAIVAGVDGSPQSLHAVDWAAREAAARQRPLLIVHAFLWPLYNVPLGPSAAGPPDAGLQHAAEKILATAVDRARKHAPTLEINTDLPVCAPAAALIGVSHHAGLVVIGHRGLGGFTGLLVGSVGVQTAAHAACPVVVVRSSDLDGPNGPGRAVDPGEAGEPGSANAGVVVGVDGSDHSILAVDFAFAHAALHSLSIIAVHAYRPAYTGPSSPRFTSRRTNAAHTEPTELLTNALAGYRDKYPGVAVRHKIVHGVAANILVAESAGAALTVVGSRGRGGFTGLLLGSTSHGVLHHAAGSVAIVPAQSTRPAGAGPHA